MTSTVSASSAFVKPTELGDLRADIARYQIRYQRIIEATGVSGPKLSKYLNGKMRLPRSLGDTIQGVIHEARQEHEGAAE